MTDTLIVDSLRLAQWRTQPKYGYDSEFKGSDFSLMDWLASQIDTLLQELFGGLYVGGMGKAVIYVLGFFAIATIIGVTFYRHPELLRLRRKEKQDTDYTVEEDTIYGIRFDEAIAEARSRKDYREVVRLTYLKTLRALSDADLIHWIPSKTPLQYVAEYEDHHLRHATMVFVRIRYGGFEATEEMADEMTEDNRAIEADIAAKAKAEKDEATTERNEATTTSADEKGGKA